MDEVEDPTIKQPHCSECGLPIRSQSFELETPFHQYEYRTKGGLVRGGGEGVERPKPFHVLGASEGWIHDDPRGVRDHAITPQAWGPRHSHETDYERQTRNWQMEQLEKKHYLGGQFNQ